MLYRIIVIISVLILLLSGVAYSEHLSQRQESCVRYIDLVWPQDGSWNTTPLQSSDFLFWEDKYNSSVTQRLKLEEVEGYKLLIVDEEFSFYDFYHKENKLQTKGKNDFFTFVDEQLIRSGDTPTTWWERYSSVFQSSNEFSNVDCENLDYGEWLNLTNFFDVFPVAIPLGFRGIEILLDDSAKKILIISTVKNDGKVTYDGALIVVDGDRIVHFIVSGKDADLVRASLVETAKVL